MTTTPSIPTAASLRKLHKRLAARNARDRRHADRLLATMKEKGDTLCLYFQNGRPLWSMASGGFVPAGVAAMLTADPDIVPYDGGLPLLVDMPAQTWRYL